MPAEAGPLAPSEPTGSVPAASNEKAKRMILWDGVFFRLMDTLTGSVFLTGLALYLGASPFIIGILAALPFLAQVAHLPAAKLLLHTRDRRRVVLLGSGVARVLIFLVAPLLLFTGDLMGPGMLAIVMAVSALFAVMSTSAWNWWMRDVIGRAELGRYFGRRLQITTIVALIALLAGGAAMEFNVLGTERTGYIVLFAVGGLSGMVSLFFLAATPHPIPAQAPSGGSALEAVFSQFRDAPARKMVLALTLTTATLTTALPFTAAFLLSSVGYGFLAVATFVIVSQLAYVAGLTAWANLSDRYGNRPVMHITVGMALVALAGWAVAGTTPSPLLFAFFTALHFLSGFAIGGLDLTVTNVLLKSAPADRPFAYLAGQSFVRASVAGLATVVAGAVWGALGTGTLLEIPLVGGLTWSLRGFHVLALASTAFGVLALVTLSRIQEEGRAPVVEVARTMRREVRSMSSIAGIRAFVHTVSYVVEFLAPKPPEERRRRRRERPAPSTRRLS